MNVVAEQLTVSDVVYSNHKGSSLMLKLNKIWQYVIFRFAVECGQLYV